MARIIRQRALDWSSVAKKAGTAATPTSTSERPQSRRSFLRYSLHDRRADVQVSANLQHPDALGELVADGLFRRRVRARAPYRLPALRHPCSLRNHQHRTPLTVVPTFRFRPIFSIPTPWVSWSRMACSVAASVRGRPIGVPLFVTPCSLRNHQHRTPLKGSANCPCGDGAASRCKAGAEPAMVRAHARAFALSVTPGNLLGGGWWG